MKNKGLKFILLLVFFLIKNANSQVYDENKNVWNFREDSNVKAITVKESFITKPLCRIKFVKQQIPFYNYYEFNKFGEIIQSTMFDGQYIIYDTLIFYKEGKKEKLISIDSLKKEKNQYTEFSYNKNGNMEKEVIYDLNGIEIREERISYPSKNKIIRRVYYEDTLHSWMSKEYSLKDNNLIKTSLYQSDSTLISSVNFIYDKYGNKIKLTYSNDSGITGVANYIFDSNHLLIESKIEDYLYNFEVTFKYKYKYDENNNWIERICKRTWYTVSLDLRERDYLLISREISY